jgi:hypothetical protein
MTKILKISRHKLELAKVELTGPSLLIGRSPMCDQVLRAPGIEPVHFLLEWVGEGEFNPSVGMWTLFDIGHLVSGTDNPNKLNELSKKNLPSEGIVIDKGQSYLGLNWAIVEDRFNSSTIQKGIISNQLMVSVKKKNVVLTTKLALEVVCMSQKEQKVQEIWHFFEKKIDTFKRTKKIPFNLIWSVSDQVKIEFVDSPKSIFNIKGQTLNINSDLILFPQETIVIHFLEEIYFVRFISRVDFVPQKEHFFQNKFWIATVSSLLLFCLLLIGIRKTLNSKIEEESKSIVRVVKVIEIEPKSDDLAHEIPPAPKPIVEPVKEKIPEKVELAEELKAKPKSNPKPEIILTNNANKNKAASAVAPTFKSDPGKATPGLNSPGKVSDVNAVGLLGKIKSKGSQSANKQISAEEISQTFVDSTASGTDNKGVQVQSNKMTIIGNSKKGTSENIGSDTGNNLLEAQTTLKGAKDFSASNSGLLARSQGLKGTSSIGTGLSNGAGVSSGGNNSSGGNSSANGTAEVSGGLTKAQVFGVINSHRREIRTCFESALLVRNDLNGILRMSFSINIEGFVTEVKVVNSEIDSNILERCVIQIIRQMNFPQTPNQLPSSVIYPFVFKRVK